MYELYFKLIFVIRGLVAVRNISYFNSGLILANIVIVSGNVILNSRCVFVISPWLGRLEKPLPKYDLYLPSAVFIAQMLVGPSKQLKQIIQIEQTDRTTGRRQTSWLFTSVAEDLNSGLPRNKSTGGDQSRTRTRTSDHLTLPYSCFAQEKLQIDPLWEYNYEFIKRHQSCRPEPRAHIGACPCYKTEIT